MRFLLYASENITAMLFGLLGAAMVARVFGPENMGRLSIVQSASAIFIFLATLGLDHFVVREFTRKSDDHELKCSLLISQTLGWFLYVTAVVIFFVIKGDLQHEIYLIASVTLSTFFLRAIYLKLYLQAINQAKVITLAAITSRVFALVYLIIGTLMHFSFDLMIVYLPIQAFIQTIMMWLGSRRGVNAAHKPFTYSFKRMFPLVKEALPVLIATAVYYGYSQADVLIVSYFMNDHDVGIYAAAMRLIPQAAFVGHIAAITFYSSISASFDKDFSLFVLKSKQIVKLQIILAICLVAIGSLLSTFIIYCLYGDKFSQSAPILSIGVWAWLFMFPAALFSRMLVLTKLAKFELMKAFIVAPISLGMNFLLIPKFGLIAASFVTVMTYLMGDFLVYFLFKKTRFIFYIGVAAFKDVLLHPVSSVRESFQLITKKQV